MKVLKWIINKVRNTFLILLASLIVSLSLLVSGIVAICIIVTCIPSAIVGILVWAIYLMISGWFRTGTPEWQKSLIKALEKFNKDFK